MDESRFDELLKQFKSLNDDMRLDIGRIGLARVRGDVDNDQSFDQSYGDPIFDRPNADAFQHEMPAYLDGVLNELKTNVYTVKLFEPMRTLINPLYFKLQDLQLEAKLEADQRHHEGIILLNRILTALWVANDSYKPIFTEALQFQYQQFMRHPMWNTMKLMNDYLISPVFRAASGILFGFKKEMTVEEKILEAIQQQTQFLMKGEIEPSRGFFQRLMQGGLVGMAGRGVLTAVGAGRGMAQSREAARARGEAPQGGIRGALADRFMSQDITRLGRHGFGRDVEEEESKDAVAEVVKKTMSTIQEEMVIIREGIKIEEAVEKVTSHSRKVVDRLKDTYENSITNIQMLFRSEIERVGNKDNKLLENLPKPIVQVFSEFSQNQMAANDDLDQKFDKVVGGMDDEMSDHYFDMSQRWRATDNHRQETTEREFETLDVLKDIRRDTKITAKEAIRARMTRMLGLLATIGNSITNVATSIAKIGAAVVGGVLGVGLFKLGGAAVGALGAAFRSGISGIINTLKGLPAAAKALPGRAVGAIKGGATRVLGAASRFGGPLVVAGGALEAGQI